jgi:hypothetical protein
MWRMTWQALSVRPYHGHRCHVLQDEGALPASGARVEVIRRPVRASLAE